MNTNNKYYSQKPQSNGYSNVRKVKNYPNFFEFGNIIYFLLISAALIGGVFFIKSRSNSDTDSSNNNSDENINSLVVSSDSSNSSSAKKNSNSSSLNNSNSTNSTNSTNSKESDNGDNYSSNKSNQSNNSNQEEKQTVVSQTIYVKNTDEISFDYDSSSVKIKDGKLQCIKDDRILQWDKGNKEWECNKVAKSVFGDLDNSVEVNGSGQLECKNDGDVLYWDGDDDQWACGSRALVQILAGNGGILSSNNTISINAPTCSGKDKLQWNGSNFVCATDENDDEQTLSFNTNTNELSVSNGNSVDLSSLTGGSGTTDHNSLTNLQGGTTNEYYHLTNSEFNNLNGFLGFAILPSSDGSSGQVLKTDGSGNLSWVSNVSGVTDHTLLSNVGTNTHAQIDTHIANTSNPHSVTATQVGLSNVDNTADLDKPISTATQSALNNKEDAANKGVANGYTPLDSGGKVPVTYLPNSIMEYKGIWDASINTPTLVDGTGDTGDVYRVSVAGGQDLGSGSIDFNIGDYVIYNGSIWEKSDTTDSVGSVFGRTGVITAQSNDYTWGQINKTTSDIADITTRSHNSLTDIGTNTHTQIDTHIASTSNPHLVTATQVGNTIAQWNANKIKDITVDDASIADGKVLQYNSTSGNLEYVTLSSGTNDHNALTNLQGGTTNEYYHLDSNDYTDLSTFLGFTSLPDSDGTNGQVLKTNGSGTLSWQDDNSGSIPTVLVDADNDTKIQVEESSDEDKIRFDTFGTERMVLDENGKLSIGNATTGILLEPDFLTSPNQGNQITMGVSGDTLNQFQFYGFGQFQALDNGMQFQTIGSNAIAFAPNSSTQLTLSDSKATIVDDLGIGQDIPTAKIHIKGTTSDNTAYGLKLDDSSDAKNLYVRNDGQVEFKNFAFPTADGTNGQVLKTNGSGTLSWQDDSGVGTVNYSDVTLDSSRQVGSPTTATTLDKAYDYIWSAGLYSGFGLTDNGDGTVNIADGEGVLRTSASPTAPLQLITVSGVNNLSMSQTATNYIYADYNSGSPVISVGTSTSDFNCLDKCILYKVARVGNEISYINMMSNNVDANRSYRRKDFEIGQIDIGSGARVAETGNRYFTITAGSFWNVLSNVTTSAFDTSVSDTYDLYYRNGSGGWTRTTGNTQIDNLYYDDGSGTLATISNNQFATRFIFMSVSETGSHPIVVMGQYNHANQEEAENESVPGDLPPEVDAVGSILALVTVQKNATNLASILNATEETFSTALPTTHNNLSGLQGGTTNEYYHLDSSDYTDLSTFLGFTSLPNTDGTNGQVLTTNGSGSLSFSSLSSLASYAEMYQVENATATTITTQNVWEEVNNFSQGEVQGVTFANSDLTIGGAGKYQVNISLSGTPESANDIFEFAISVNDTIQIKTMQERKFSSTTDAGSISLNGILSLSVNDVVKLELLNQTATGNFTVENANLTLRRID